MLCLVLGVYSVYKYTKLFYEERTAKLAALIMASCCAVYLMTYDVRADTILTGWVIFSIWQLAEFNISLKFRNLVFGAIGVGMAMLAKGPIGLIIPVTAFSAEFIYKRQWKNFFRWQYLVVIIIIALMLLPMIYGLYKQFDLHPEKTEYGIKGQSGIKFYFWTQSFGRITGENYWKNNPDPFFLIHSFFWSFLPWTVFFLPAIFTEVKNKIKAFKAPGKTEVISISGFLFVFIFLMRSKYQLPHYTFPLHPLAAVITANYLNQNLSAPVKSRFFSVVYGVNIFVMFAMYALAILLIAVVFPAPVFFFVFAITSLLFFLGILFYKKINRVNRILLTTLIPFITLIIILTNHFYPTLLTFQLSTSVSKELNRIASDDSKLLIFRNYTGSGMVFYCKIPTTEYVDERSLPGQLIKGKTYIIADSADSKIIQSINPAISAIKSYKSFGITHLNLEFLNPSTRNNATEKVVLFSY